jgi:hypothetical protein
MKMKKSDAKIKVDVEEKIDVNPLALRNLSPLEQRVAQTAVKMLKLADQLPASVQDQYFKKMLERAESTSKSFEQFVVSKDSALEKVVDFLSSVPRDQAFFGCDINDDLKLHGQHVNKALALIYSSRIDIPLYKLYDNVYFLSTDLSQIKMEKKTATELAEIVVENIPYRILPAKKYISEWGGKRHVINWVDVEDKGNRYSLYDNQIHEYGHHIGFEKLRSIKVQNKRQAANLEKKFALKSAEQIALICMSKRVLDSHCSYYDSMEFKEIDDVDIGHDNSQMPFLRMYDHGREKFVPVYGEQLSSQPQKIKIEGTVSLMRRLAIDELIKRNMLIPLKYLRRDVGVCYNPQKIVDERAKVIGEYFAKV